MQENHYLRLRLADNKDCPNVIKLVYNVLREYDLKPDPAATNINIKDIKQLR